MVGMGLGSEVLELIYFLEDFFFCGFNFFGEFCLNFLLNCILDMN